MKFIRLSLLELSMVSEPRQTHKVKKNIVENNISKHDKKTPNKVNIILLPPYRAYRVKHEFSLIKRQRKNKLKTNILRFLYMLFATYNLQSIKVLSTPSTLLSFKDSSFNPGLLLFASYRL